MSILSKGDLVNLVSEKTGESKKDTNLFVDAVFGSIKDSLAAGDSVNIRGFGSFISGRSKARVGRNPANGESVNIPSKQTAKFKSSKDLFA